MGWCVAQERCRDYDPRNHVPGVAELPLCEICLRVGERAVHLLVYDYVDLAQQMARSGAGAEHVSGTMEASTPLDLGIEALQRAIWLLSTTWEQILREHQQLSDAPTVGVRDGWAVQHAGRVISPRIRELVSLPAVTVMPYGPDGEPAEQSGAQALLAITRLHSRCRSALGLTRLTHELPGQCSGCGLPALRRDDGTETVYCANCAAWWSWEDYRDYSATILAAQPKRRRR